MWTYLEHSKLQKYINHFKKNNIKGNIIFVLSTYGLVGPDKSIYENLKSKNNIYGGKFTKYTCIPYNFKSGLLGLTKYLATTFGKDNIRVNINSRWCFWQSREIICKKLF